MRITIKIIKVIDDNCGTGKLICGKVLMSSFQSLTASWLVTDNERECAFEKYRKV